MILKTHLINDNKIAEIISDVPVIHTLEEGLDLLGYLFFQNIHAAILHEKNLSPLFFQWESGLAEALHEEFCNYQFRLVVVGKFEQITCKKFKAFMEMNTNSDGILFSDSFKEALIALKKTYAGLHG
jgi:hypothetical protein